MESLTPLWSEILITDFDHAESKPAFLAERIVQYIEHGNLVDMEKFPSITRMVKATGISRDTIQKSLALLRAGGYIATRNGIGSYVIYGAPESTLKQNRFPEFIQQPKESTIQADQFCVTVSHLSAQTFLDKAFMENKQKYYKLAKASEQNMLVPEFFHVLCGWLNNLYKTAYADHNVYYCHDFHFIVRTIAIVIARENGIMVVPKNSCITVRNAFESANLKLAEVSMDSKGFCVDELAELCRHHDVYGVYLMSNANFPDTVHTDAERLELLVDMQKEYGFTIIEDDRYASWFESKGNRLLDLNRKKDMDIIYLRPVSLLHEQLCRLTVVAAHEERIVQISHLAEKSGNQAYQSIANAAKDVLIKRIDKKVGLLMSKEIAEVTAVAREVLSAGNLWMEAGIMQDSGMGFYLVPRKGRFPEDIYEKLNALNISVVDPASYCSGRDIPGIRLSLAWYVGKKTLRYDLIKIVSVLKDSLLEI